MYCYICSSYGHIPDSCPNRKALAIRKGKDPKLVRNIELKVENSDAAIRILLKSYGVEPNSRQQENKKLLHDLANSLTPPRLITFVVHKKNDEAEAKAKEIYEKTEATKAKN